VAVKEAGPFAQALDRRVTEGALGTLYEKLPDNKVRCYACAHQCLILDGLRGICKVRYNQGGTLMVPHGYVGALQCDPTEKKPFFHVFPGSDALTMGMLGCDLHCSYCFAGETRVATSHGLRTFAELWEQGSDDPDGDEHRRVPGRIRRAIGDDGGKDDIRWIFRHAHDGDLVRVVPRLLAPFEATPDHPVLATRDPGKEVPSVIPAETLTPSHFLVVPRRYPWPEQEFVIDVEEVLRPRLGQVKVGRHISLETASEILQLTAAGGTSVAIGSQLGLRPDYVRHVRARLANRGGVLEALEARPETLVVEGARVRFGQERRPGIPSSLVLTSELAELFGYYCAEGCVVRAADRPNSRSLIFAFGLAENKLADRCRLLLERIFEVTVYETTRSTTRAVTVGKASVALLFEELCGPGSAKKRLPEIIHHASKPVVEAFLRAYVAGDGHRYDTGKVSITTVSEQLAWDIAWLALQLGYLPGIYKAARPAHVSILGRVVKIQPYQYTVAWYEKPIARTLYRQDENFYYIPIRGVERRPYEGYVYNLETASRHTYLANFAVVHNCQNWVTSQALRDPGALSEPMDVSPSQLVDIAQRYDAKLVATSYNEPLITSEWAVDVFKEAKRRGFTTAYISNGNATRQVLEYIRPWTNCYKIDLKSMRDKAYRSLGGKLENILNGIRMVHEMGFWLEIVTLTIPGFNDSDEELRDIATFLVGISPAIPWHVTAFHKDYKMLDPDNTPAETLIRGAKIGEAAGLQYIYAGNLPGRVGEYENTRCPQCQTTLIRRFGYRILEDRLSGSGRCFNCGNSIPGVWN
jgi:pyruvate formate lyase activating enzyme